MGKESTFGNGRWVLSSNGNGEFYEEKIKCDYFKHILSELNGNAIVFNYPGVGASTGMPNRSAMAKAYRAILHFLEDQDKGVGTKEIIGYGHSMGGGVQGDALISHQLKQGIKYLFIKSRTFSDLSTIATQLTNKYLGSLVKFFGWNINSVDSSTKLKAPEIIMQTAKVEGYEDILKNPDLISGRWSYSKRGFISQEAYREKKQFLAKKYFLGIPDRHNHELSDPEHLAEKVSEMLA